MAKQDQSFENKHVHFVMVHGASHGGWCWYKIRSLMETSGYKVTCVDLKSAGIDPSNHNTLLTFDQYNEPLIHFLSNVPENHKVILVGHSAGGLSLTDALHKFPNKIYMAIYVAANMLKHGFVTEQDYQDADPDLSKYGDVNEYEYEMGIDSPPTSSLIKQEYQRKILYQLSPKEDSTLASMLLRPAPLRPFRKVQFIGGNDAVDRVPRVYIKTMKDNVLKLEQQEAMIKKWQPCQVFALDSDHSPFFSTPFLFFGLLINAIAFIKN